MRSYFLGRSPYSPKPRDGILSVMLGTLWHDDSGEISEYALILSLILMLGITLISQTGTTLKRLYQGVSTQQATAASTAPNKK